MKSIYVVIFVLLICCSHKSENVQSGHIIFEHVGNSDKPLTTIVIATYPMSEGAFKKVVVVDKETFNSIYEFVDRQEDRYRGKRDATTWLAFQVSTSGDDLIGTYIIPSEKSRNYFKDLKEFLNKLEGKQGISEIQKELDILLKRIGG
jgi:hypothetical protein